MRCRRVVSVTALLAITALGCGGGSGRDRTRGGTLVLAQLFEPSTLDPALESSIVQFIVVAPIFETLVRVKPGSTEIGPGLARSWDASSDGRSWTFRLQPGVVFHDGTPFDAQAVCANFERWYHFTGIAQSVSRFWRELMRGYATAEGPSAVPSLYRSCDVRAEHELTVNLTNPVGTLIPSLALPAFAIASPEALRRYEADKVTGSGSEPRYEGTFGTQHPIGTGPFRFESWTRQDKIVLVRNDQYWGSKPDLERLVIRRIDDGAARRQALESGEIDGALPVDPGDLEGLRRAGFAVFEQPGFNVGYVALNQAKPPLDNLKIRQAIAHAIDEETLVSAKYPASAEVARQFLPPGLWGRAPDPAAYAHDPARARQLIAGSGATDLTVEFWYPTSTIGPAFPDPEAVFLAFKADLEKVGLRVVGKPVSDLFEYYRALRSGGGQISLADNYAHVVDPDALMKDFQERKTWFGLDNPELFALLDQARGKTRPEERAPLYERASRMVMEQLPVVPFVHVKPAVVFAKKVRGYVPGAIPWEGLTGLRVS